MNGSRVGSVWAIEGKITRFEGNIPIDVEPLLREKGAFYRDGAWWAPEPAWVQIKSLFNVMGIAVGSQPVLAVKVCTVDLTSLGEVVADGAMPRRLDPAWLGRLQARRYIGMTPLALDAFLAECRKDGIDVRLTPRALALQESLQERARRITEALDGPPPAWPLSRVSAWGEYQRRAVGFAQATGGRFLLGDEPGLGKTVQGLAVAAALKAERVLVICPSVASYNWADEIAAKEGGRTLVISSEKPTGLGNGGFLGQGPKWVIISYALLAKHAEDLKRWNPDLVIPDESQYLKGHDTLRTKAAKSVCRKAKWVVGLTGTPIKNRSMDLWSQLDIINPGWFGNRFDYGIAFADGKKTHFGWQFKGSSREDVLHQYLKQIILRRKTEEVRKDLPPKRRTVLPVDLAPAYRTAYDQAWNGFIKTAAAERQAKKDAKQASIDGQPRPPAADVKTHILTQIDKLRHISSQGRVGGTVEKCLELFEEGKPVVVFAYYRDSLAAIASALKLKGMRVAQVDGSTPPQRRVELAKEFQEGKLDAFVGQIEAAGVAINLFRADTTIAHDLVYSPTDLFIQAEGRVNRIGQVNQTHHMYVIGRKTLDEQILKLLMSKVTSAHSILDTGRPVDDQLVDEIAAEFFR